MTRAESDWFACSNCGAEVPAGAAACPECGSDDETGWSEDAAYDGLDRPAPEGDEGPAGRRGLHPTARVVAVVMILLIVFFVVAGFW